MQSNVNEATSLLTSNQNKLYDKREQNTDMNINRLPISFEASDLNCMSYSTNSENFSEIENTNDLSCSLYRYRYYLRLGLPSMPYHILPSSYMPKLSAKCTQKSVVTIFAIWNTMMGASLLSMPWAIHQAGFGLGVFLVIAIASLAFYTAYVVLKATESLPVSTGITSNHYDFTDACRFYLGRTGEVISILFSFLALLGGLVVYYVLLCNFLYFTVQHIYEYSINNFTNPHSVILYNKTFTDVICPIVPILPPDDSHNVSSSSENLFLRNLLMSNLMRTNSSFSVFSKLWSQTLTVPFWLLIIIMPLISIKSATFFTKFNALGTISVAYLLLLVIFKAFTWGIHMDSRPKDSHFAIPNARSSFIVLTGLCSLAFFIHNAIHSIMRNQSKPKNNTRDLLIAYICVASTYLGIGVFFYVAFPFPKDCIQDNLLNNLSGNDIWAFIGRIALFFQMLTVFPLLMYILRSQFMHFFYKVFYPSWLHVFSLHIFLIGICIIFAVFIPHIGEISRFSGAVCGLVYIFALPALVKIQIMRKEKNLSIPSLIFHISLIVIGVLNFVGQFVSYIRL